MRSRFQIWNKKEMRVRKKDIITQCHVDVMTRIGFLDKD